ncbi:MAG: UbiX family flavin prenyltransferase [Desulforudis sp.]|jgi:4-hydroxy-3-polyprenylbenzoate decarboxylase|nr:UbiX family flavin prenyltransferase [Clostridia bacterium]MDQ7790704.1 UbiX family flavin prenyltransferase [Clostridia bacterium]RJX20997.1 MAG: UbiX family flavin prenyltransferase [Desulforudis sp.]
MRIVVAITGASGALYGVETLRQLTIHGVETHLVVSDAARFIIAQETGEFTDDLPSLASYAYSEDDFAAPIASGSFRHDGMVIAPCSMKTLAAVATGYASNLIQRAADVTIKEGRKLVLLPRETPFSAIHLENMLKLARLGTVIMPPVPAFYNRPETIGDIVGFTVGRVLDQLGVAHNLIRRWGEPSVSGDN